MKAKFLRHALAVAFALPVFAHAQDAAAIKEPGHPLLWLGMLTLLIGIGIGVWQLFRVKKAKANHEHASMGRESATSGLAARADQARQTRG